MDLIFPLSGGDVDLVDAYAYASTPWLRINMVSSLDGVIERNGTARDLSSDADRKVFHVMRSLADVVLVGAGTARRENYGPILFNDDVVAQRRARGQSDHIPVAIVTRSCAFDWSHKIFTESVVTPLIYTVDEKAHEHSERNDCEIVGVGENDVDVSRVRADLYERGLTRVLCEGGPSLNETLLQSGLVDELCLTLSPQLAGHDDKSISGSHSFDVPSRCELTQIIHHEGDLFLRYSL